MFGHELRASATGRLRPAAVPCWNRKFMIQDSKFRIKGDSRAAWALCSDSGRSLRRSRVRTHASSGPSLPGGCGPLRFLARTANSKFKILNSELLACWTTIMDGFSVRDAACGGRARLQGVAGLRPAEVAARCGSLPESQIQHSRFKISFRAGACEWTAGADLRDANCGPSRGEAPARCGSLPEPQIQNSRFNIQN